MPQFRKRSIVVTAEQFDSIANPSPFGKVHAEKEGAGTRYMLHTPNGAVPVDDGDWIVDNTPTRDDDYYPVKPDVFEQLFEPVPERRPAGFQ